MAKKRLFLLRHAKSSWKDPQLDDPDRPLNSRGRQAAERMGRLMRDERIEIDLVICSTARRTRETADRLFADRKETPTMHYLDELYHADAPTLARVTSQISDQVSSLMIIGHNPGLEEVLLRLTGELHPFPTAMLAWLEMELSSWKEFSDATRAELARVWRPRELDSD